MFLREQQQEFIKGKSTKQMSSTHRRITQRSSWCLYLATSDYRTLKMVLYQTIMPIDLYATKKNRNDAAIEQDWL